MAPAFDDFGFLKPDRVHLINKGGLGECLISPRSAKEYGVEPNCAGAAERPSSLVVEGGRLPMSEVMSRLDQGLYISNLWYLNYSDRRACRMTGMTRFATLWVEGGRALCPVDAMRFDETIYRVLGRNLVDLTDEREVRLDPTTYRARSSASMILPGVVVDDFTITL
jgi:predicted Zn-dependent protease